MKRIHNSLQQQFVIRMAIVLLLAALLSGAIQLYYIQQQIASETDNQAMLVAQSVNNGIQETLEASSSIEHQIDLRLVSYSAHIADLLKGKAPDQITSGDLTAIRDRLGLAGITIMAKRDGDIVGVSSTDAQEIGFSLKKVGFLQAGETIIADGKAQVPGATFVDNGAVVLPIAQSASHEEKPTYFKYAYYHAPGTSYMINLFIKADEVSQFIQKVGPDAWIAKVYDENPYVEEVAVLTPKVFVDPTLEKKLYPPVKKVVNGKFKLESEADNALLKQMAEHPEKRISIQKVGGNKVYKMFLPIQNDQAVYIAMDYGKMSAPLYRHSLILIIFGLLSLIALFILAARFFNAIYRNIQQIIKQIKRLEVGDFTAKSSVTGGGELSALSDSANTMADAVSRLLKATQEKATMAQKLSVLMETDANQSVDKVYTMSMETTATARVAAEEIHDLLNKVERALRSGENRPPADEAQDHLDRIRQMLNRQNSDTAEMTITLADLFRSLHNQSSELSELSDSLLSHLAHFKL